MPTTTSFAVLALAAGLAAQAGVVSPRPFTTLPGSSLNTHPLGPTVATSPSMRYQGIHDDMQGRAGLIKGLAFRLNEGTTGVATTIVMEVRISTAAGPAAVASSTFDLNHGADRVAAVPASTPFNFGAFPPLAPGPTPFLYAVPFQTSFAFAGAGGIAWEMLIASRTNTASFSLDATSAGPLHMVGVGFGSGCLATGRMAEATATSSYSPAMQMVTPAAADLTSSAPGVMVLGLDAANWGPLSLPFDLPGTTGHASGTCRVHNDFVLGIGLTATATGGLSLAAPLVTGPTTLGIKLFHYGATVDLAANALGVVTSQGRLSAFGDGQVIGGCRVYAFNDVNAMTGIRDGTIVITRFQY
jgi:hypothetical protein